MSKFKKLMILTFTMIFAVAVSATIVSFSFADRGEGTDGGKLSMENAAGAGSAAGEGLADSTTNIDHIIEKAVNSSLALEDRQFHILQIVSDGNTDTGLKKYVTNDGFRQYVINANKTIATEMPKTIDSADSIVIDVMTVADLETMVAASTDYSRITIADLIYVSNNPASGKSFAKGNDLPEDVYNLLHTYAIGDDKPLIIDYASASSTESATAMTTLVTNVLANNYVKYRSFEWSTGVDMKSFLDRSQSVYIPIDLSDEKYKDNYVSKIAVIYDNAAPSTTMYDAITGNKQVFLDNAYYRKGYKPADIDVEKIDYTDATKMTAEYLNAFDAIYLENGTYASMADGSSSAFQLLSSLSYAKKHIIFSGALKKTGTQNSTGTGTNNETNFSELLYLVGTSDGIARYSNIMLSNNTMFDTMAANPAGTTDAANEIAKLLKSSTYREYGNDSASGKKFTVLEIQPCYPIDTELAKKNKEYYSQPDNVYKKSKEMTPDGKEYYAFELTVEKLVALTGLEASQINLVQVSTEELQGMKTTFNGNYDLIYIGGNNSALTPADAYKMNGSDYISNFAAITKQVNNESMYLTGYWEGAENSSNFIVATSGKKGDVIIGEDGNSHTLIETWVNYTGELKLNGGYPYYRMYSHTGNLIRLQSELRGYQTGNYAYTGGNDLSYDNMTGLMDYVDAGMPVIISDDLTDAYKALADAASNIYVNGNLDPDSNMYKLLVYALEQKNLTSYKGATAVGEAETTTPSGQTSTTPAPDPTPTYTINTKSNVLSGFDKDDVIAVSNLSKQYGDTLTTYAVIFNDGKTVPDMIQNTAGKWIDYDQTTPVGDATTAAATAIQNLIKSTNSRPVMKLTKMPKVYVPNTPSSYVTGRELAFDYELDTNGNDKISAFVVTLYVDDNSNGIFTDAGEAVKTVTVNVSGGVASGTLTYTVSTDFYGPVNWKIEAVAVEKKNSTTSVYGAAINYSAVSKISRTTQDKQLVNILQIMPKGSTNQDKTTLYFCPDCQLSNTNAQYNPTFNSASTPADPVSFAVSLYQNYKSVYNASGNDNAFLHSMDKKLTFSDYPDITDEELKTMHFGIGLHEHEFGIWKYDSAIGYDDWYSNLADTLTGDEGDFEFNINIFNPTIIDTYNTKYGGNAVAKLQTAYENAKSDPSKKEDEIAAAKKAYTDKQNEMLEDAALQKETYENYKSLTAEAETDLRNVLTHFAKQFEKDADNRYVVKNSTLRTLYGFAENRIKDETIFQTILDSKMYWDLYSNNHTDWRDHDYQAENHDSRGARKGKITDAADDKMYVFTEGGKTYRLGKEYKLLHIYEKKPDGSNGNEVQLAAYTGSTDEDGYPDVLDYENYNYEYSESELRRTYSFNKQYYANWADAKSREIISKEKYEDKMRAAYGKHWMEYYGMIILGAAEDFDNQDLTQPVCDALKVYEKNDGNLLLFHDTMSKSDTKGAVNLTNTLAEVFGMDRFHLQVDAKDSTKVALKDGYDENRYFTTIINTKNPDKTIRETSYSYTSRNASLNGVKRTLTGVTSTFVGYYAGTFQGAQVGTPYTYAGFNIQVGTTWTQDNQTLVNNLKTGSYGTNRASQLNSGIITSYPFAISKELNISPTHNQFLALDVEDKEVITWYTLSGANNKHDGSSYYAADPGDAADNYFIFSKGNVNYCGAGHSQVTGPLTDNNDERMLFINIICNAARKSAIEPSIEVYDPDTKLAVPNAKNKYIRQNADGDPYIEVSSETAEVKFGFKALMNTGASETLKSVKIYFQYEQNGKMVTEVVAKDPLTQDNKKLSSDIDYYFNTADTTAKKVGESITLKPEYFSGYDDYTYIYIEVESETSEKPVVEKIRIDLVRDLFDLT